LVNSQSQREFYESLIQSDLCTADGMAVVWLARLLGIPIKQRIAGADFLGAFSRGGESSPPLKLYLFGGGEGVAAAAANAINARSDKLRCVGWQCPGFASAKELSRAEILDEINASGADFLLACLGASKGQSWLLSNHRKLGIPVRAHLGATLNFEAGVIKRAPQVFRKWGAEWLWRIKEEPYLWRRYFRDAWEVVTLFLTRVLPLLFLRLWLWLVASPGPLDVTVKKTERFVTTRIVGPATVKHMPAIVAAFRRALVMNQPIVVDLSKTTKVDARFLGLVLVLRKLAMQRGRDLSFHGLSPLLARIVRLSGVAFPECSSGPSEEIIATEPSSA
jgi:N-acetylglucosaminyldiphosphoundecaprenol N-acetyl-beta-D-mannosaminyltransferase